METSTEIRWFWPSRSARALQAMKLAAELGIAAQALEERVDRYLLFPSDTLGVKIREGRLEIKQRLGSRVAPEARGVVEQWVKWSAKAAAAESLTGLGGNGVWVEVRKRRRLAVFGWRRGKVIALAGGSWPEQGCNVELTDLLLKRADGREVHARTLGFEAFGEPETREACFWGTFARCETALRKAPLVVADSYAYPGWLTRVAT